MIRTLLVVAGLAAALAGYTATGQPAATEPIKLAYVKPDTSLVSSFNQEFGIGTANAGERKHGKRHGYKRHGAKKYGHGGYKKHKRYGSYDKHHGKKRYGKRGHHGGKKYGGHKKKHGYKHKYGGPKKYGKHHGAKKYGHGGYKKHKRYGSYDKHHGKKRYGKRKPKYPPKKPPEEPKKPKVSGDNDCRCPPPLELRNGKCFWPNGMLSQAKPRGSCHSTPPVEIHYTPAKKTYGPGFGSLEIQTTAFG